MVNSDETSSTLSQSDVSWTIFPKNALYWSGKLQHNSWKETMRGGKATPHFCKSKCTVQLTTEAALVQKCSVLQITFSPQMNCSRVGLFGPLFVLPHSHLPEQSVPKGGKKRTLARLNQIKRGWCEPPHRLSATQPPHKLQSFIAQTDFV